MATLTYDNAEFQEGEFSEEELDSIAVGEQLEQEQGEMLAGKFRDAEQLEKAYLELQRKLGEPREESDSPDQVEEEEPVEEEYDVWDALFSEGVTDDVVEGLDNMTTKEIAEKILEVRGGEPEVLTDEQAANLRGIAGGDEGYGQMMEWAQGELSDNEIQMYDAVMQRGDPLSCFFAVQALTYRYNDAVGVQGEMLTGSAAPDERPQFRSQAEMVRAMSDPRYDTDPAYRQDVMEALENSNLNF